MARNDARRDFRNLQLSNFAQPHLCSQIVAIFVLNHKYSWRNLTKTCSKASPCKYPILGSGTSINGYSEDAPAPPSRSASAYNPLHDFVLPPGTDRHYSQQFADMYFLRLMQLKKTVKQQAEEAWRDFEVCHVILLNTRRWTTRGCNADIRAR
jgi:hypothetical protein